jgi:hypothetical protein
LRFGFSAIGAACFVCGVAGVSSLPSTLRYKLAIWEKIVHLGMSDTKKERAV